METSKSALNTEENETPPTFPTPKRQRNLSLLFTPVSAPPLSQQALMEPEEGGGVGLGLMVGSPEGNWRSQGFSLVGVSGASLCA